MLVVAGLENIPVIFQLQKREDGPASWLQQMGKDTESENLIKFKVVYRDR